MLSGTYIDNAQDMKKIVNLYSYAETGSLDMPSTSHLNKINCFTAVLEILIKRVTTSDHHEHHRKTWGHHHLSRQDRDSMTPEAQNNSKVLAQKGSVAKLRCYTEFLGDDMKQEGSSENVTRGEEEGKRVTCPCWDPSGMNAKCCSPQPFTVRRLHLRTSLRVLADSQDKG
ncbi:uncharacterized protein LOC143030510 [Oratosquilla oratoria]|uniref:uncharacterized protein LOC143030510 n=1 Tax=Oratosquilla oratoria TaxID=337810 RepID=UPI003F7741E7